MQNSWVSARVCAVAAEAIGCQDFRGHGTRLCGTTVGNSNVISDRTYCIVVLPYSLPHAAVNPSLFTCGSFSGTIADFFVLAT